MRKINNLLFCIEPIEYFDGYEKKKFNAFYYMVDGKKIDFGSSFQPASVIIVGIRYGKLKRFLLNKNCYIQEKFILVLLMAIMVKIPNCGSIIILQYLYLTMKMMF